MGITVLSLFDGISCGRVALEKAGIIVDKYYSSEIDKYAMQISKNNYPDIIQLGDITQLTNEKLDNLPKFDLLIGGSPCQGFSIAGKKLNFEDERSKLFFEYARVLKHVKPKYFLLENVKMKPQIADLIDEELGVKRVFIDSRYFTGHIRKRYYWTNIAIKPWNKREIKIKDIIDNNVPFDRDMNFLLDRTEYNPTISYDGIITINPRDKAGKQTWQRGRVYDIKGNCPTICASLFDLNITENHKTYRKLTINECEKLQGLVNGYTKGVPRSESGKVLGNSWTVDVVSHIMCGIKSIA